MILSVSLWVFTNMFVTGVAGRVAEDHVQCQSQQYMSDDVFEETVSVSIAFREKRARHQKRIARNATIRNFKQFQMARDV